jgi:alkylated DNA nucleotide flippase Atl1
VKDIPAFERIWRLVAKVPRGRVATYGQIARMAGLVNGARTVGWALRALPDGTRVKGHPVPWHRVINAQGTISLRGWDGGGEASRQAAALRREGIVLLPGGRIDLRRYRWSGPRRLS